MIRLHLEEVSIVRLPGGTGTPTGPTYTLNLVHGDELGDVVAECESFDEAVRLMGFFRTLSQLVGKQR